MPPVHLNRMNVSVEINGKSCHTALAEISKEFTGVRWFTEGDIKGCFDNIDHHVLVSLTNQSCGKYLPLIRPNGIFLYDTGLVQPMRNTEAIYVGVNMFEPYMEKFHRSQMYNICVLGVLLRLTKIVSYNAVKACLKARFKPAFHAANEAALEFGRELAKDIRDPALDM